MWCGKCQADVAAEVSSDNQRVFCTVCGGLLSTVEAPPTPPPAASTSGRVKDAQELLKRWSSQPLDPYSPRTIESPPAEASDLSVKIGDAVSLAPLMPLSPPKPLTPLTLSLPPVAVAPPALSSAFSSIVEPPLSPLSLPINSLASDLLPKSDLASAESHGNLSDRHQPVTATELRLDESLNAGLGTPAAAPLFAPLTAAPVEPLPLPLLPPLESTAASVAESALNWGATDSHLGPATSAEESPPSPGISKLVEQVERSIASLGTAPSPTEPAATQPAANQGRAASTVTRRIDAAHPRSRYSESTLPMPPANVIPPSSNLAAGPFVAPATPNQPSPPPAPDRQRVFQWMPKWDSAAWRQESSANSNWSATAGQLLAYAGVLGLTIGGCMVVWSFFGGPANYAQTGWLLATAGQMMLFFGVVTLVSGGLEQTTEQVSRRIEQLGDYIIRIEQASREQGLHGSVPAAHFGQDEDHGIAAAESRDESAIVED